MNVVAFRPLPTFSACALLCACQFIPGTNAALLRDAKSAVRGILIDPESATFRNLVAGNTNTGELANVCGEVNAKNRLGGYTGYKRFLAMPRKKIVVIDPDIDPNALGEPQEERETEVLFEGSWRESCEGEKGALSAALKNLPQN